jgi:hypothetical protein
MDNKPQISLEFVLNRMQDQLKVQENMILALQDRVERQQRMLERNNNRGNDQPGKNLLETIDIEKITKIAIYIMSVYNENETMEEE